MIRVIFYLKRSITKKFIEKLQNEIEHIDDTIQKEVRDAMEKAEVKANSEEGEIISTIAIAVSSIVTTVVIAVGVLVFSPVLGKLTTGVFKPAFDFVLPALFGALAASYFAKHLKLCVAPLIAGVVVLIFSPAMGAGTLMFITIVAAVAGVGVLYKLKWL